MLFHKFHKFVWRDLFARSVHKKKIFFMFWDILSHFSEKKFFLKDFVGPYNILLLGECAHTKGMITISLINV